MWSPNTTAKNTSDNKLGEEVEDCRCSDAGAGSSGGGGGNGNGNNNVNEPLQQQQQQQQLNIFDNSTKKPITTTTTTTTNTFSGNLPITRDVVDKEKEFANIVETSDSGFISGPHSSSIYQDEEEPRGTQQPQESEQKYNIISGASSTTVEHKKLIEEEKEHVVLDSGCIDEDESFVDEYDESTAYEDGIREVQRRISDAAGATHAIAASVEQQSKQKRTGARVELTKAHTTDALINPHQKQQLQKLQQQQQLQQQQMILKHNVDAGMSEWFCNLSLQSEPISRTQTQSQQQHQQQQQQQQTHSHLSGNSLNNLNSVGRKLASINNKQQPTTGTTTTTAGATSGTTTNLTAANAWEQFYQQNDDGDTALHLACIAGHVEAVAALIRMAPHPCLFNIQNDEAQTPLHLAALTSQPKILRMLLIAGAEPTIRDRHGNTALHLSCTSGEEQCVRALTIPISASEINEAHRQYGHRSNDKTVSYLSCARLPFDMEIRNYDGERCVHLAAQAGHIDILRILVLYGADINAREGKSGRTPLHIAIECCNEDLANYLLDDCQKLNLETATYAGLTAYQVACILNKAQMLTILEKRGAEPLTPPDSDYDSSDVETDLEDTKNYDRFGDPGYFANYKGGNPMTVA